MKNKIELNWIELDSRPWLFKRWIAEKYLQKSHCIIHWIEICPVVSAMHLWTTETSSFIFMLFLLFYPFPIPVPISAPISDPGFLVFQTPMHHSLTDVTWWKFDVFDRKWAIKNPIFTGLPLGHAQLWFRFWVVSAEKRIAGGGKTRGLVPRNDVLTSGFVRFFLARIFFYFPPQETQKALRIKS